MTAKSERLVNLTVALLETRRPLTFADIRRRTGFYDQADPESARRMFERDKDDLRRLGVPVITREVTFGEEVGYQVPRADYELPDVDLTAEEVAALALAVRLTGTEGNALTLAKLAARAPDPPELPAPATRVSVATGAVDPVAEAVLEHAPVGFDYRTAAGETSRRTIDPYAVVQRRGAWYLVGRDHRRQAVRAFRLDRILGDVEVVGPGRSFAPPDDLDVAAAVSGAEVLGAPGLVAVSPTTRWAVELRGGVPTGETHDGWPVLRVGDLHPVRDLPWLLGMGAEVVVLEPEELRLAVLGALRRLAAGGQEALA